MTAAMTGAMTAAMSAESCCIGVARRALALLACRH
jgi:hypothetical protein